MAGMLVAVLACSVLAKRIEGAKLYHFDSDHDRLFRSRIRAEATAGIEAEPRSAE
jgi:hypothetical protein